MVKIIHTSDWHLGRKLDHFDRAPEHAVFMEWLLAQMVEETPDALLVCGDIFDSANPPIEALKMFARFVVRARDVCSHIIFTAGNHDSALRLEAYQPFLTELGVTIIGRMPNNVSDSLVSIYDGNQKKIACVGAIPYIRPMDLPPPPEGESPGEGMLRVTAGIADIYRAVTHAHLDSADRDIPLILMGHLFVEGGETTPESERPVQIEVGKIRGIPSGILPLEVAYFALGHLHRCQEMDGAVPIHYSGTPVPMTFGEAAYPHHVLKVVLAGTGERREVSRLEVPRPVEMYDLSGDLTSLEQEINTLKYRYPEAGSSMALLRVTVLLDAPDPGCRDAVLAVAEGARLQIISVRAQTSSARDGQWPQESRELEAFCPWDVFVLKYRGEYDREPSEALKTAFLELLAEVEDDTSDSGVNQ